MSDLAKDEREPCLVRCGQCKHEWTVAYLPMPLAVVAEILRSLHCPMCGADSRKVFLAL